MRAVPAGLLLVVLAAASPPAQAGDKLRAQVDRYLQPFLAGGNFSGAILIACRGNVLLRRGYGMANLELNVPNTSHTRFHIASLSKPFTATAILMLEASGRLHTSDPLARFVPDFPNGDRISLQQLLTHTSGVADINDAPFYEAESHRRHTPESLVRLIRGLPPQFAPGERYAYSNSNYQLLAYVIEQASGTEYGEFLRRNIFDPLGMGESGHDGLAGALVPNRASGYVPFGPRGLENAPALDWSVKTGNGSLYSTVEDLFKFERALSTGVVLPPAAREKILGGGRGNTYGWFGGERFGRKYMSASGRSPGFTSSWQRYPSDDVCVIVLSNSYSTVAQAPIAVDLAAMALGEPYAPPPDTNPISLGGNSLEAYAGEYVGGEQFFFPGARLRVTRENDALRMRWSTGAESVLAALSETEFLDRLFWARVRFVRTEKGPVTKLLWRYDNREFPAERAGQ
jgi:CubicO group peptidase (beta-lactamase class C family)